MLSLTYRSARSSDLPVVTQLLAELELPVAGVAEHLAEFVVAEAEGTIVGVAGLERYGAAALLRSVAVRPFIRNAGVARSLVSQLLQRARANGVGELYLLTTTASEYFGRTGFQVITRADVPAAVQESIEFREACPASATVMRRRVPLPDAV